MNRVKTIIHKTGRILLNLLYYTSIVLFGFIALRIFVFGSYKIPTDSMELAILPGDYVMINNLAYGARLFNLSDAVEGEQVKIKRMPSFLCNVITIALDKRIRHLYHRHLQKVSYK
ncbi:S26 family signal peptidase [Proteiniphilum acetatigenes]|uniref:S26 family signal peptidase n=1 Tax=Proteiniphilum acetatigenes TaxID=294710 RepID=UPI000367D832|nr:S26 family signal peptidase [Proteiniphilum acetatigenes]SFL51909.1 signal peptidase I [Porphyromonadaceae bacterium KH3CP3RA]